MAELLSATAPGACGARATQVVMGIEDIRADPGNHDVLG
jgi:hypothetical protein